MNMKTEKLSNFIGKPVLILPKGELIGRVKDLLFDRKLKRASALLVECEKTHEQALSLRFSHIHSIDDAVIIKSLKPLKPVPDNLVSPYSLQVYNSLGKFLGSLHDIYLEDRQTVQVVTLEGVNKSKYDSSQIAGCFDAIIIKEALPKKAVSAPKKTPAYSAAHTTIKTKNTATNAYLTIPHLDTYKTEQLSISQLDSKINNYPTQTFAKRTKPSRSDDSPAGPLLLQKDYTENDNSYVINKLTSETFTNIHIPTNKNNTKSTEFYPDTLLPTNKPVTIQQGRIVGDFKFLLLRKVNKHIYNSSGKIIIKKDTLITAEIVNIAKASGQLIELTRASL